MPEEKKEEQPNKFDLININEDTIESEKKEILKPRTNAPILHINDNPGFLTQLLRYRLRIGKELEASQVFFDTYIKKLKIEAQAEEGKAKALFDAGSAKTSERIKTDVQDYLDGLQAERLKNKNKIILEIRMETYEQIGIIEKNKKLSDDQKIELIETLTNNMNNTVLSLSQNEIAKRYELN